MHLRRSFEMFQHIQLSALAVGAFLGYVVPFLLGWLFIDGMFDAAAVDDVQVARRYFWLMLAMYVLAPVLGGFCAARISKYQPLLHGLLSGLVGGFLVCAFREETLLGLLVYCALAGVVGGWLGGRTRRAST